MLAERINIPLRALGIIDTDIGGLAAHGQPNVVGLKVCVNAMRYLAYAKPLVFGIAERQRSRDRSNGEPTFHN